MQFAQLLGTAGVRLHVFVQIRYAMSRFFNRTVTKVSKNLIAGRVAAGPRGPNLNKAFRFFRYQGP
jgi:hypothetical protein